MTGEAIIAKLTNLESIEGADRIVQGTIFGETVIVSVEHKIDEVGVLFDCETQLSHEFCHENNLYRHAHLNKDPEKQGYIEDNRRVRPIRLKGVKCSGLWMPMSSLVWAISDITDVPDVGTQFKEIDGTAICEKYLKPSTRERKANKQGKARENLTPTFKEHIDTDQFMRNLQHVKSRAILIITEKLHGTSCRVANLEVDWSAKRSGFRKFIDKICAKLMGRTGVTYKEYGHVVGSRRVVKQAGEETIQGNSYYEHDIWSQSAERFRGKLEKGETVYYEIVGYLPDGKAIMPGHQNQKLSKFLSKDEFKTLVSKFGPVTNFSYGCHPDHPDNQYEVYVYRMTLTNVDGHTIDYTWDQVMNRCEQMGVKHVPELARIRVAKKADEEHTHGFDVQVQAIAERVELMAEQNSDIFTKHIREGVCVRIDGPSMTPKFFKQKAYLFKVLEGIIKDTDKVDIEEEES